MKQALSLKKLINVIMTGLFLIIFSIQAIFIYYINGIIIAQKKKDIDNVTYQINSNINSKLEVLQQTQKSIASAGYLQDFLTTDSFEVKNRLKYNMIDFISNIQDFNIDMIYFMLFDKENTGYSFSNNIITEEYNKMVEAYNEYLSVGNSYGQYYYKFFTLDRSAYQETYLCSFTPVQVTDYINVRKNIIGTAVVCSKVNMTRLSMEIDRWQNIELYLSDGAKEITLLKSDNYIKGTERSIVNEINIPNTTWKIRGTIYISEMEKILRFIQYLILLEFFVIIVIFIVLHIFFRHLITNPIQKIIKYLDSYYIAGHKERLVLTVNKEINIILEHINYMLTKVENMTRKIVGTQQKIYEKELGEKKAVLYALQNQINPHFLYNTLECVRSIAYVYKITEIVDITTAISDIMRYTIKGDGTVKILEEICIIEEYFTIMKIRYPNRFETCIDIPDNIRNMTILKMILQPIVENAFNHGLFYNNNKGEIYIRGYIENDFLMLSVEDNGGGIKQEKRMELLQKMNEQKEIWDKQGGIGLVNISNRIKINYGKMYGLDIYSKEGEYTRVMVRLPKLFL